MAKTRKNKEEHDEKIMKENIQKRFEHMFTGEGEPLSNMSIQEVEALQARIAQLETELAEQPQALKSMSVLKGTTRRSSLVPAKSPHQSRRGPQLSVSIKSILTFAFVFILAAILQYQYTFDVAKQEIEQSARQHSEANYEAYVSRILVEQNAAEALATSIAQRADVQELFLSGKREELYELLLPAFMELKESNRIVHLYLEDTHGKVFLRVHDPERFGDDVTYRETVVDALKQKRVTSGIEIGVNRIGVRGVSPLYAGNTLIGLIEVGLDFDEQFVNDLKELHGADYSMWVTDDAAAPAGMKPREDSLKSPLETMFYYTGTINSQWNIAPEVYEKVLATGEPTFEVITQNTDSPSIVYILPLRGYKDKIIGIFEIADSYRGTLAALKTAQVDILQIVSGLTLLGLAFITFIYQRLILRPLGALAEFAKSQLSGDTSKRVFIKSHDEFEQLASSFNNLADRVDERQQTLEQRVVERTHDLELAAEVGRMITEKVTNASEILTAATELIRNRFDLYYTQVYLTDAEGQKLVLRAGTGEVGKQLLSRGHQLLINPGSLNGQAVLEKSPVIVADTGKSTSFKPNPLLPKTRSEMAVPLLVEDRAIGVLDLQSEQPDSFSEDNLAAFEAIAGQLAIAIQNANLFMEIQEARDEVEAQVRRFTEQGWQDFLDAISHEQKIGFAFDQSRIIRLEPRNLSRVSSAEDVSIPISITGTQVGEIHIPLEKDRQWTQHEVELIKATSAQLAQHIENLRLLAQADQYRAEAQQAVRRLTREGWDSYLQTYGETEPGYLFDLSEVKPLAEEDHEELDYSIKHPMIVRDETIGELAVKTDNDDEDVAKLLEAVGKQLSDHLENLRLSELNEKRAYREHALRQITSALRGSTNPATIMRTAVRELGSILGRRAIVQLATPEGPGPEGTATTGQSKMNASVSQS